MSPEARVGLVTILAFLVAFGFAVFLPGGGILLQPRGYDIVVAVGDASGIDQGAPVRMSGVQVGRVSAISLSPTNEALLTLTIQPGVRIAEGSRFQVATSGLVGERYIAVVPAPAGAPIAPGTVVRGEEPFSLERSAQRLERAADQVSEVARNANALLTDPEMRADLRAAMQNAREATAIARDVMVQARSAAVSVGRTASAVEGAAERMRAVVDTDVVAIAEDLRAMSERLVESSERVRVFVETTAADGRLSQDIRETASSLRETGQRIRQMAEDLQGLINSENVGKARDVVDSAREAVAEARGVVRQAGSLLDRVGGILPEGLRIPERQSLFTFSYEVWHDGRRAQQGIDATLLPSGTRSYRIGMHDIGGTNGVILQIGGRLTDTMRWRAGVYESQVGLGLDYRPGGPVTFALDVYNVNAPTADARLRYQVSPRWSLTLGGTNLTRNPAFVFGVGTNF